jgi:hypothetical protein
MCSSHYRRFRKHGESGINRPIVEKRSFPHIPANDRFWMSVKKGSGCWEWIGTKQDAGYGRIIISGKAVLAHRMSFEMHKGIIPPGMQVCHKCDNPPCVNPDHLFLGTAKDNAQDCISKGRKNAVGPKGRRVIDGVAGNNRKLTPSDVLKIREDAVNGMPNSDIAKKFNVSDSTISRIVNRNNWRHL